MFFMPLEQDRVEEVELKLRDLVWGIKGVRHIRPCSKWGLGSYKISFGYQRKEPLRNYLLIYDPDVETVTLVADGGIFRPPGNVRQRLFDSLGRENYEESYKAFHWTGLTIEDLASDQ